MGDRVLSFFCLFFSTAKAFCGCYYFGFIGVFFCKNFGVNFPGAFILWLDQALFCSLFFFLFRSFFFFFFFVLFFFFQFGFTAALAIFFFCQL